MYASSIRFKVDSMKTQTYACLLINHQLESPIQCTHLELKTSGMDKRNGRLLICHTLSKCLCVEQKNKRSVGKLSTMPKASVSSSDTSRISTKVLCKTYIYMYPIKYPVLRCIGTCPTSNDPEHFR